MLIPLLKIRETNDWMRLKLNGELWGEGHNKQQLLLDFISANGFEVEEFWYDEDDYPF